MATTSASTAQALAEAMSSIDAAMGVKREITAPKAYAAHQAHQARIAEIGRRNAEAIKSAPGYSAKLGAFVSPTADVAFLAAQLAADGVAIVREGYGFRTMTAAEKAGAALKIAAE